ncbi:MAG: hypothetical protein CL846_02905 [Crocinitomicaceae bacterium]|nr:hypothetical protein [Crocinitomicaceae bacterium]|tara:strand:- start:534 stop:2834 length:2301 start_codon:yes stop_codon:yes gene_type:complete
MSKLYLLLFATLYSCIFLAQETFVSGKILDAVTKEPLIGVNIKVNNSKGTVTDFNGEYTLSLEPGSHKIMYSYIGYQTQLVPVQITKAIVKDIYLVEENNQLDVMVVSASKFKQKLEEVTVSVDVIGAKLIESKNCITLADVIRNAPGVQLTDGQLNIRAGSGWSYGTGSRVLVMVDDMPILSADQGEVEFNLIPMENVEQMEIIKGASSALYGSSALNGVVNIKTKMPGIEPKTTVGFFQGFWDAPSDTNLNWWGDDTRWRSGVSMTHSRKIKKLDLVLSANHYNDKGFVKDVNNVQTRLSMNTRYVKDDVTFGINANYMQRESPLFAMWSSDTSAYIPFDGTAIPNAGSRFYIDPYITFYKNFFKHTLRSRILRRNITYVNNNPSTITSLLTFNEYQNQYRTDNTTITSGATLTTLMGRAYAYGGELKGKNISGYTQIDYKVSKWNFSGGARYEYFDLDTIKVGRPVFRAGVNYKLKEGFNVRASFGQGFRFPTITELYMRGDIGPVNLYNNLNLRPESGWTSEIGFKKVFKIDDFSGYIDLVGFLMEYNDMMEFTFGQWGPTSDPLFGIGFISQNVGTTKIPGFEFTLNGSGSISENFSFAILSGFTWSNPISVYPDSSFATNYSNTIDYTFNNTSSDTTGSVLKYRHRQTVRFDLEFKYKDAFSLGFSYQYNAKMINIDEVFTTELFNLDNPNIGTVDLGINNSLERLNNGYHLFDARIKYKFENGFTLGLLGENIFNTPYLIRPANMGSPRTFMLQLRAEF